MSFALTVLLILLVIILAALLTVMLFFALHLRHLRKIMDYNERTFGQGEKKALLIYQPSKHASMDKVGLSIAENLAANGYTVTLNHPRPDLPYRWSDYQLIALGSPVYIGQVSQLLKYYAANHKSEGLHFLLFTTGVQRDGAQELGEMAAWLDENNAIDAKKFWLKADLDASAFVQASLHNWSTSEGPYFLMHKPQNPDTTQAG